MLALGSHIVQERLWCRSDTAVNVNYVDRAISDACLGGDALDVRYQCDLPHQMTPL